MKRAEPTEAGAEVQGCGRGGAADRVWPRVGLAAVVLLEAGGAGGGCVAVGRVDALGGERRVEEDEEPGLMGVVVEVPALALGVRVALFGGDAALGVLPGVDADRDPGVPDEPALEVTPLLVLAAVAELHQQGGALRVDRQRQAEVVVLYQAVLRQAPLLREQTTQPFNISRI